MMLNLDLILMCSFFFFLDIQKLFALVTAQVVHLGQSGKGKGSQAWNERLRTG